MTLTRALATAIATTAALALALTGCSQQTEPEASAPTQEVAAWPRTIDVPAAQGGTASTLTIEAEPLKIAALDYESAEVLAELGLASHLVLIPEAVLNPALGSHVDALGEVPNTFPVAMEVDAETVISLAPDLAVMSPRHGNEEPIATVLQQAGIPALQLPVSWTSPETLATNVELIGQATGTETAATALVGQIASGLAAAAAGSSADGPRILVLTNQAGRPFITAGSAYPLELLELAGARNVSAELGIERTGPIGAEQIVQANPDGVVLIDMNGTGDRMYAELLANPAVSSLPAFAEGRVLRIEGKQVQALGLTATVDGLRTLTDWAASLR